jgi:hypothetical protein
LTDTTYISSIWQQLKRERAMQAIRDWAPQQDSGRARRLPFRRRAKAERRAAFVRSEVRRGPQASSGWWAPAQPQQWPEAAYEKLMTLRLQAAIVAAMLGMSLFFRAPLTAALLNLLH